MPRSIFARLVAASVSALAMSSAALGVERNDLLHPNSATGLIIPQVGQRLQANYSSAALYSLLNTSSCKAAVFTMLVQTVGRAKADMYAQVAKIDQLEDLHNPNKINAPVNNGALWPPHDYPNGYQNGARLLYTNVITSTRVLFGSPTQLLRNSAGNIDLTAISRQLTTDRPVMLRGRVCKLGTPCSGDARDTRNAPYAEDHWVLAVDVVKDTRGNITSVQVNDPWTGVSQSILPTGKFAPNSSNPPLGTFGVVEFTPVSITLP